MTSVVEKNIRNLRKVVNQKSKLRDELTRMEYTNRLTRITAEKQFEPVLSKLSNLTAKTPNFDDYGTSSIENSSTVDKEATQISEQVPPKKPRKTSVVSRKRGVASNRGLYRKSLSVLRALENQIRRSKAVDSPQSDFELPADNSQDPLAPTFELPAEPSQDPLAPTPENENLNLRGEFVQRSTRKIGPGNDQSTFFGDPGTPKSSSTPQQDAARGIVKEMDSARGTKRVLFDKSARERRVEALGQKSNVDVRRWLSALIRLDPTVDQSHYGPRLTSDGRLKLGGENLELGVDFLRIGSKKYPLGRGLVNLIFAKEPQGYSKQDLKTYGEILFRSNAVYVNYSKFEPFYRNLDNGKFTSIISGFLPSRTNLRHQIGKQLSKSGMRGYKRIQKGQSVFYLSDQFLKKLLNGR